MAGHNKWSKVKHIKGAVDAKRGKLFSKLAQEISVAARAGDDPDMNARLRRAIDSAKAQNMPKDNIERAVLRGSGGGGSASIEEALYEGFACGGASFLVEALTDNRNRSFAEVRNVFTKAGGSLGASGSVAHSFKRLGQIILSSEGVDEEELFLLIADFDAEDLRRDGEEFVVLVPPENLSACADVITGRSWAVAIQDLIYLPQNPLSIEDTEKARKVMDFIDKLEDCDDVQNVFTNAELSEELIEELRVA